MDGRPGDYRAQAREILEHRPAVRAAVTGGLLAKEAKRREAYAEVPVEAWRDYAAATKDHVLAHLGALLEQAEERLGARGAHVHWADGPDDVAAVFAEIVRRRGVTRAVKAKTMISEELGVNPRLEALGVEVFETDLGEFIIQLAGEAPSHITGPAVHRSLADVQALFHEKLGTPLDASPEALGAEARRRLREAFLTAGLGISGANFVAAETGTIALIENEGNIRLSTSAPPVHVALVGIEKVVPRLADLAVFLSLSARAATGQRIGTYVSLVQGPRRAGEPDGPEEVHVVFVDNGRTRLLADPEAWPVLRCVRCGACQNACPVFRQTGGHAYGWVYGGPIGAILAPGLLGLEQAWPLPHASSLCGACADVCPVKIPIPELLVAWRRRGVEAGLAGAGERALIRAWTEAATHPALWRVGQDLLGAAPGLAGAAVPEWTGSRGPLDPGETSFREIWEEGIE